MKGFAIRCAVLAALGSAMLAFSTGSTTSANAFADPEVKEIMRKANGKDGLCKAIGAGLKLKEPKWEDLSAKAKELLPLAKAMGKNDPPKGDKESWTKFTDAYAKAAEDLDKAATAKDAKAAGEAIKSMNCAGCHAAHRPKK